MDVPIPFDEMSEIFKEFVLSKVAFWLCLLCSLGMLIGGFVCPPMGVIDGSVLKGVGEIFGFATLAVVYQGFRDGLNAKMKKGDLEIEINKD